MIFLFIPFILGLLLGFVFLFRLCLIVVTIESGSMVPTLQVGERVLVLRCWWRPHLSKGQIVLFWFASPTSKPDLRKHKPYIKRVIGLAGETLSAEDVTALRSPDLSISGQQNWYIPEGHIFVRGDNRHNSLDSLHWGPLPIRSVLGIVLFKLPLPAYVLPPCLASHSTELIIDQPAPSFVAQTLAGECIRLETYQGIPTLLVFFAPKMHCREVLEACQTLEQEILANGIAMIFVSSAGTGSTCSFIEELQLASPLLLAPHSHNPFFQDYGIHMTPAFCLITVSGRINARGMLLPDLKEMRLALASLEASTTVTDEVS